MGGRPTRHCDGMYDPKLEKLQERFRQTGEATPRAGLETGSGAHHVERRREIDAAEQHRKRSNEQRRNG